MARRTTPPFRADHVGSLLRPRRLLQAREDFAAGRISAADLRSVEDQEIPGAITMQEEVGLQSATDGEFRRASWHMDFIYALGGVSKAPVVHTVHGPLDGDPGLVYRSIQKVAPEVGLISISMNQRRPQPDLNWVANVPNALDLEHYPCQPHRGDYLLYLGRMNHEKGAHRAVAVAMELGLPLKLAGKMQEPREREYFAEFVEPHLGHGIEYLGEVNHGTKVELLQNARATLFPIEWEEPFGLVMIESMACGTPVIATRWGAVPEVIEDGHSGIIVDDYTQMAAALEQADELDPLELRRYVEKEFSPQRMVNDYVAAYEAAIVQAS